MADIFELFKQLASKEAAGAPTGPVEYIVVGLGNPGAKYESTRHNVGFLALEKKKKKHKFKIDRLRFQSLTGETMIGNHRVLFLKPSTFMNLSGRAVVDAMNFYKIPIEKVIVICDDVALEPGRIRIRSKGSDGGHNGLKNIIYLTGQNTFPRVKIGVGAKPHPEYDMAAWVLSVPETADRECITKVIEQANDIVSLMITQSVNDAMNRYNGA